MLKNIFFLIKTCLTNENKVYLQCVFHGIRFKVRRLEVVRLPSFFRGVPNFYPHY
jgi:hypothetical protein